MDKHISIIYSLYEQALVSEEWESICMQHDGKYYNNVLLLAAFNNQLILLQKMLNNDKSIFNPRFINFYGRHSIFDRLDAYNIRNEYLLLNELFYGRRYYKHTSWFRQLSFDVAFTHNLYIFIYHIINSLTKDYVFRMLPNQASLLC